MFNSEILDTIKDATKQMRAVKRLRSAAATLGVSLEDTNCDNVEHCIAQAIEGNALAFVHNIQVKHTEVGFAELIQLSRILAKAY